MLLKCCLIISRRSIKVFHHVANWKLNWRKKCKFPTFCFQVCYHREMSQYDSDTGSCGNPCISESLWICHPHSMCTDRHYQVNTYRITSFTLAVTSLFVFKAIHIIFVFWNIARFFIINKIVILCKEIYITVVFWIGTCVLMIIDYRPAAIFKLLLLITK